jgi:glutathione-specific gamma-glutamylcyclotransferase
VVLFDFFSPKTNIPIPFKMTTRLTQHDLVELLSPSEDIYVFGYGSLIWKADFHYASRSLGYIRGYVRRFWQYSMDHRGTNTYPGMVVTLLPKDSHNQYNDYHDAEEKVWGMVYRIPAEHAQTVLAHLNYREKNGYRLHQENVYHKNDEILVQKALLYIATADNEAFHGIAPLETICARIVRAQGPSGKNIEYLLNLVQALKDLIPEGEPIDKHLLDLVDGCEKLAGAEGAMLPETKLVKSPSQYEDVDVQFEHILVDSDEKYAEFNQNH